MRFSRMPEVVGGNFAIAAGQGVSLGRTKDVVDESGNFLEADARAAEAEAIFGRW